MLKVHYHSDCPFFAGCENMLACFLNSKDLNLLYEVSFSYRSNRLYKKGLNKRVHTTAKIYPLTLPDLNYFTEWLGLDKTPSFLKLTIRVLLFPLLKYLFFIYDVFYLSVFFRRVKPNILHINNGGYPGALSARAAAIAGKLAGIPKVIMVVNNMAVDYSSIARWLDYPIDTVVKKSVDGFITGSLAAKVRLMIVLNIHSNKVNAIHNGIAMRNADESRSVTLDRLDLQYFNGVIFGVVALLIPRKGHQVLLNAVLKIIKLHKDRDIQFKILIEGEGYLKAEFEYFVNKHNLSEWVVFVGNEKNIIDFMHILDVLVLPSIENEDFPNVILEAMGLGKAIIASRIAGTPEQVLDGVNGFLVGARDSTQLSEAMLCFIDKPSLISTMGQASMLRFNKYFTSKVAIDNYMKMYKKILK